MITLIHLLKFGLIRADINEFAAAKVAKTAGDAAANTTD
jgi:hypothetical protein